MDQSLDAPFVRLMRALALPLTLGALALVLLGTLYPFQPQFGHVQLAELWEVVRHAFHSNSGRADQLANVLLFMPLGFGLAALLARRAQLRTHWLLALLACGGLSLAVETCQVLLPGRVPTVMDVLTNSMGGGLGLLAYAAARQVCATRLRFAAALLAGAVAGALLAATPGMGWFVRLLSPRASDVLAQAAWMPVVYALACALLIFGPFGMALALLVVPLRRAPQIALIGLGAASFALACVGVRAIWGGRWPTTGSTVLDIIIAIAIALAALVVLQPAAPMSPTTAPPLPSHGE